MREGKKDKLFHFSKKKREEFNLEKKKVQATNQNDSISHKNHNILYAHPQRKS